jgi:hypothetical protein
VFEDPLNGTYIGNEGDDPHRFATARAEEREDFIDPCEQHGPEITSTGTYTENGHKVI